jgi:hypothetical protein
MPPLMSMAIPSRLTADGWQDKKFKNKKIKDKKNKECPRHKIL